MRRSALLVLCIALSFTACETMTADTSRVSSSSTTTTSPPPPPSSTTTTSPSTTPTTASPTTPSVVLEHAPPLLVAHDDGIDLWTAYGKIPVLTDREVGVAFPDLAGGVVFSAWDDEGRNVIEWVPHLGDGPEMLVADPDARWLHPTQVTWLEGQRTLVYRKIVELPNDCPSEGWEAEECRWGYLQEYLHVYDLDTGADETLGGIGSFESDYVGVRFGGGWASITYEPYGALWACSVLVPTRQFLDSWLDPWPFGTEVLSDGTVVRACDQDGPDLGWAAIMTDGSSWMRIVGTWEFPEPWRLIGFAPDSGDELFDIVLPEGFDAAGWSDCDGRHVVLSTWHRTASPQQDEPVFLVDLDGTVTELDLEGRATIWSPPYAGTTVTLRSDGVGPSLLGDPVGKVMTELTALFGQPDRDTVVENTEPVGIHDGLPADLYFRSTVWEHVGLEIVISDGVSWPDGREEPVLIRWSSFHPGDDPSLRLLTPEGIRIGSTVDELHESLWGPADGWESRRVLRMAGHSSRSVPRSRAGSVRHTVQPDR